MKEVRYVRQEERYGCAIACCAMILGRSYQETKLLFPLDRQHYGATSGMDNHDYLSFMFAHGFIGYSKYKCESHTQKMRTREDMTTPFAPIHIIAGVIEGYTHAVLWLADGRIYDPFRPGVYSIDKYPDIYSITGFWNLP